MTLPFQRLDADVAVAPQLGPEAMAEARAAGFASVVCNRPDGEGGLQQPTSAEVAAAAQAAGLQWAYQPVLSSLQTEADFARFAELIETLPKPILAYCRSGARCGRLWQGARQLRPAS